MAGKGTDEVFKFVSKLFKRQAFFMICFYLQLDIEWANEETKEKN